MNRYNVSILNNVNLCWHLSGFFFYAIKIANLFKKKKLFCDTQISLLDLWGVDKGYKCRAKQHLFSRYSSVLLLHKQSLPNFTRHVNVWAHVSSFSWDVNNILASYISILTLLKTTGFYGSRNHIFSLCLLFVPDFLSCVTVRLLHKVSVDLISSFKL